MMMRYASLGLCLALLGTPLFARDSDRERDRGRGAAVGAVAGALIGGAVDGRRGAVIGALGGAATGAVIGHQRRDVRRHALRGGVLGGGIGYSSAAWTRHHRARGAAIGAGVGTLGGLYYGHHLKPRRETVVIYERVEAPARYVPPIPVREREGAYHATQEYWNLPPAQRAAFRAHLAESGIRVYE